jgi:hypothetical protein
LDPVEVPEDLVVLMAIAAGRRVVHLWESTFPSLLGPRQTIVAAEHWEAYRDADSADAAAVAAEGCDSRIWALWSKGLEANGNLR